jgi:hypothetical protein
VDSYSKKNQRILYIVNVSTIAKRAFIVLLIM